jgi:hypothetical protein
VTTRTLTVAMTILCCLSPINVHAQAGGDVASHSLKSTQAQIAEEMNFSVNVVKNYLHTAEVILGADNRCHAIALGMRRGIIQ